LGALAHPVNNTAPAMDRLKPTAARMERKEIWEYNMLEFLTIVQPISLYRTPHPCYPLDSWILWTGSAAQSKKNPPRCRGGFFGL
jgi:hypothetical protein